MNDTSSEKTTYHFMTPNKNFNVSISQDRAFPIVPATLSRFNPKSINVKGSASRKHSNNKLLLLNNDSVDSNLLGATLNASQFPAIKSIREKKMNVPKTRYSSNIVHLEKRDNLITK